MRWSCAAPTGNQAAKSLSELAEPLLVTVDISAREIIGLLDYPVALSPFAKRHRSEEGLVERFEAFVDIYRQMRGVYRKLNGRVTRPAAALRKVEA